MEPQLFRRFCHIAYERAGIALKEGKEALVTARVSKRLRALGLRDAREYLRFIEADGDGEELVQFLDVITTNFTRFYREPDHFEELGAAIRAWHAAGRARLRIWCAAASSGEEPYTIAITALEALGTAPTDTLILATDLSTRMLARAAQGVYEEDQVASVDAPLRARWFRSSGPRGARRFEVAPRLRELVVFRRLNLATPPFPMRGPLDAVLCRNVMIYFDRAVRQRLVAEIERLLAPGGLLFIGHTETLTGIRSDLVPVRPSVYRRPPIGAAGPGGAP